MATIYSLAPETLGHILELIARSPGDRDTLARDPNTLLSAALVCTSWRDPAQRALFQTVSIHERDSSTGWLQSEGRGRFRVRDALAANVDEHLVKLLQKFDGVQTLEVLQVRDQDDYTLQEAFFMPEMAGLRSLHLRDYFWWHASVPPDVTKFPFRLNHLHISTHNSNSRPPPEFLQQLLHSASQSLTSLVLSNHVDSQTYYKPLLPSFPVVAGRLRHLCIHLHPMLHMYLLLDLCTALITLRITFGYDPTMREAKESFQALAAVLPNPAAALTSLVVLIDVHYAVTTALTPSSSSRLSRK